VVTHESLSYSLPPVVDAAGPLSDRLTVCADGG